MAQTVVYEDASLAWDWTQGSGGAVDTFDIQLGTAPGSYTLPTITVDDTVQEYKVSRLVSGPGTYYSAVLAENTGGQSANSNEVDFTAVVRSFVAQAVF